MVRAEFREQRDQRHQQLVEAGERDIGLELSAGSPQCPHTPVAGEIGGGVEQCGLSHTGITEQGQRAAESGGVVDHCPDEVQFAGPAGQAGPDLRTLGARVLCAHAEVPLSERIRVAVTSRNVELPYRVS